MIPIAGSAYTYSYATLGEIFAWIIGWDLILEYVVSNVAVAVGFSGYTKAQLAAFGIDLPDRWASPVWASGHWTGAYFNVPGFPYCFHPDLAAGPRREGIGRSQQRDGAGQNRRDSDFPRRGRHAGQSGQLDAVCPFRIRRNRDWRRHRFLYLHRLRFGIDCCGGMQNSAARPAFRNHRVTDHLHDSLCRRRGRAAGHDEVHDVRRQGSCGGPGGLRAEATGRTPVAPLGDRRRCADWG